MQATTNNLLIGCDIGTSSTKSILVDTHGCISAASRCDYPMYRPQPGWAENNPDDWVNAVMTCILDLLDKPGIDPTTVKGMSFVAQRDPLVFLDKDQCVLGPSISWTDMRDINETHKLYDLFGRTALTNTTGLAPIPGVGLPIVSWIQKHRPHIWNNTHYILSAKDFILFRLTGIIATDISLPARSMLYDLNRLDWSDWICQKAGINTALLPPVRYLPWEEWGTLLPQMATRLGLPEGVVIAAGGGDDPAATLGAGGINVGDIVVGTGTASSWRVVTDQPKPDLSGRCDLAPHLVPDRYLYEFVIPGTGTSFRWFRQNFCASTDDGTLFSYEELLDQAAEVPPGANGLFFFPYLEGSRAPRYNDYASGVFFGIRPDHQRSHFVRAMIEGIAFQYPLVLEQIKQFGIEKQNTITLVDDEARSPLWNQIKADVTEIQICTLSNHYAAAMGAAMLAAQASGLISDTTSVVNSMVIPDRQYIPQSSNSETYREIRKHYEAVYEQLDKAFIVANREAVGDVTEMCRDRR